MRSGARAQTPRNPHDIPGFGPRCSDDLRNIRADRARPEPEFVSKAREGMLEAAVAAATLLQRAGAKAAERIPQLPEEERQKQMGYKGRAALSLAGSKIAILSRFATL